MIALEIVVILIIIGVLAFLLYKERQKRIIEKKNISFIESFNLTGLPIISFVNNDQIINLILDTGSNTNIIDTEILKDLNYKVSNTKNSVIGITGETEESNYVLIPLSYRKREYNTVFLANDMSKSIAAIKETCGVTVHGLLGTGFFAKYKYVLDFNEMIAYSKSKN
jgi:hypothetical protein